MFTQSNNVYKDMSSNSNTVRTSSGYFQQPRANRDHRLHTYPTGNEGLDRPTKTNNEIRPMQSLMDGGSVHCSRDPVMFPRPKPMTYFGSSLCRRTPFQSPARVFARLKANACRKEAEGAQGARDRSGYVFLTPRNVREDAREANWTTRETHTSGLNAADALTSTRSPRHVPPESFSSIRSKRGESSPMKDTPHCLMDRYEYTPVKTGGQVTTNIFTSHMATPSRASNDIAETPSKWLQRQSSKSTFGKILAKEAVVSLERCPNTSPAGIYAHLKERESRRLRQHCDSPTREFTNGGLVNDTTDEPSPPAHSPVAVLEDLRHGGSLKPFMPLRQDLFSMGNPMSPAKTFSHMKERWRQQQEADNVRVNTEKVMHAVAVVSLERCPNMSPAKMYARLKERESRGRRETSDSPTREITNGGHRVPSRKKLTSTAFDQEEIERGAHPFFLERGFPAHRFLSEAAAIPALQPEVLVKDPLLIHSPQVRFPQKHKSIFKQHPAPLEKNLSKQRGSGLELAQWRIKCNGEGVYVDGIRTLDKLPWHSTIIMERISNCVLKTASGSTYTLIGKMNMDYDSKLPKWFLSKFADGFPPNWKMHYERFLSQAKNESSSSGKDGRMSCPASAQPTKTTKRHRSKPPVPPASCSAGKTSRSGRTLKSPLEFWKGGRVFLDSSMNITVHEAYETSVSMPPHSTVFQPPTLQRKVKATNHCNKAKTRKVPPSDQIHPPEKGRPRGGSSQDKEVHAPRSSNRRCLVQEVAMQTALVPRHQRPKVQSPSKCRDNREAGHVPKTVLPKKLNIPASKEATAAYSSASSSQDIPERRRGRSRNNPIVFNSSQSSNSSDRSPDSCFTSQRNNPIKARRNVPKMDKGRRTVSRKDEVRTVTRKDKGRGRPLPPIPAPVSEPAPVSAPAPVSEPAPVSAPAPTTRRGDQSTAAKRRIHQEEEEDIWTEAELAKLTEAVASFSKHLGSYWVNVAMMVGTRSPVECHLQHTGRVKAPTKKASKKKRKKEEEGESTTHQVAHLESPKITGHVGTMKRKRQVRQFLNAMPKEDHDDAFTCASMRNRRFQMAPMSPGGNEQAFMFSDLEPVTPQGGSYPTVKTPTCLHITPGMMGSVNRGNDDRYIFQLQKRMKRSQVNACKPGPTTETFPLTPSVKRTNRACGNMGEESFVVREMFPDHNDDSEEADFYFQDDD